MATDPAKRTIHTYSTILILTLFIFILAAHCAGSREARLIPGRALNETPLSQTLRRPSLHIRFF